MVYIKQKIFTFQIAEDGTGNFDVDPSSIENIFALEDNKIAKVKKVGIQGLPGTLFTFNSLESIKNVTISAISKATNYCSLGSTGIFELDLEGIGLLSSLVFTEVTNTYNTQCKKLDLKTAKLVIDFLYEEVQ